jgi:hypothetical protein
VIVVGFIKTYEYEKDNFNEIGENKYGKNWPVVYILEGGKEAYVGETSDVYKRSHQHYQSPERRSLKSIHIIGDDEFNKSATLDIESLLIEYMSADGLYNLQNGNAGLRNHSYYNKDHYHDIKFELIWKELQEKGLAGKDLIQIRNSDLFKFSPYKALTDDQLDIAKSIASGVITTETSAHMIKGEPGSGKTVLAVFLVKYLLQMNKIKGKNIGLVIPMTSLRKTLKSVFKSIKSLKASMVIGPNDVVKKEYDILIVDEAHRLTRRKGIQGYKAYDNVNKKLGLDPTCGTQLDWIEMSAKHVVLFYDSNQSIKPADIIGSRFNEFSGNRYWLESQMRVLGGRGYIEYIDNILSLSQLTFRSFLNYELMMFEDVNDMIKLVKAKDEEIGLSRTVAGFAWDWISKKDKSKLDIKIDRYEYMWNSTNKDWVNSKNAINEIGCIHSVQGYDLNYAGVIIGSEFIMRKGKLLVNKEEYKDVKGRFDIQDAEQLKIYIRNIYKVLLTRGIRGTFLYVCDEELREYFRKYIPVAPKNKYYDETESQYLKVAEGKENKNRS